MLDSPYAGLMPFTEEQAPFFFGRKSECEIITANLIASRMTILYGPSGVGKSSVLNAGVVHSLRQAEEASSDDGPRLVIVSFRTWRDDPRIGLVKTIQRETGATAPEGTLADTLQFCTEQIGGTILVILDQFEEYFMYQPAEMGKGTFAAEFAEAVNRRNLRANFLVSIREDSITKLDFFKGRISGLFNNYLRIDRLKKEQASEAIIRPIQAFSLLTTGKDDSFKIEPQLVDAVLDQVKSTPPVNEDLIKRSVDSGIETPHLQLVLTRLWQEEKVSQSKTLRLETLQRLGGASEIVKKYVDTALDALTESEKEVAVRIFQFLVTPAGTKIALGVEDLQPNSGMSKKDLLELLNKLSKGESRILSSVAPAPGQQAQERYQIGHDVLAVKVLDWRRRYVAAAEKRTAEAEAEEVRQTTATKASVRRLRILLGFSAALLTLSIVAGLYIYHYLKVSEANLAAAVSWKNNSDLIETQLKMERDTNKRLSDELLQREASEKAAKAERAGTADAKTLRADADKLARMAADVRVEQDRKQKELTDKAKQLEAATLASNAEAERLKRQIINLPLIAMDVGTSTSAASPVIQIAALPDVKPPPPPPVDPGRDVNPPPPVDPLQIDRENIVKVLRRFEKDFSEKNLEDLKIIFPSGVNQFKSPFGSFAAVNWKFLDNLEDKIVFVTNGKEANVTSRVSVTYAPSKNATPTVQNDTRHFKLQKSPGGWTVVKLE